MIRSLINVKYLCMGCHKKLLTTYKLRKPIETLSRSYSFLDQFDPPYLESLKPKIPEYDAVNFQIRGYDFAILENYQSLIHKIAKTMDIEVEDSWATPATVANIKKFKPNSAHVECEYTLYTYERNVQVVDVPSTKLALFAELVQAALPQGVNLSVHEHQSEHEEIRYVPDYELKELKAQLETIGAQKKK